MDESVCNMQLPGSPNTGIRRILSALPSPVRKPGENLDQEMLSPTSQNGSFSLNIAIDEDGTNFDLARKKYIKFIKTRIVELRVRRSVLAQKYKRLSTFDTAGQITVIILSTALAALESTKSQVDVKKDEDLIWYNAFSYAPLITAWAIAVLTAVIRFFAFGQRLEDISKVSEAITSCKNTFKQIRYGLETFAKWDKEAWNKLVQVKLFETHDFYLRTMEQFERFVEFKELVFFQTKLRDDMVAWERINRDVSNMGKYYVSRRFDEQTCFGTKFNFDAYAREIEMVERNMKTTDEYSSDDEDETTN